jgi:hypothetical protein
MNASTQAIPVKITATCIVGLYRYPGDKLLLSRETARELFSLRLAIPCGYPSTRRRRR